jgi:hypothetical protein
MKGRRLVLIFTALNLAVVFLTIAWGRSMKAQSSVPNLRTRELELVDEKGTVRARLSVESDQEVVFRLLDRNGTIRVKLGASENGSGLLLTDEETEPGIHMVARRKGSSDRPATTSITLKNGEGQRTITP